MATTSEEDSTASSDKGRLNASGSEGRATASAEKTWQNQRMEVTTLIRTLLHVTILISRIPFLANQCQIFSEKSSRNLRILFAL